MFCTSGSTFKRCLLGFLCFVFSKSSFANLEEKNWVFHFKGEQHRFERYDIQRGTPRIDLSEISKKFPVVLGVDSKTKTYSFAHKKENRVAMFDLGETLVKSTYGRIHVSQPPIDHKGKILVPIDFCERVVVPLLTGEPPYIPTAQKKIPEAEIVIDPGHGGNDWGAYVYHGKYLLKEKDVVLILSLRLKEALERQGIKVTLTRDRDYFLSLPERSHIANAAKAKFFLSIHFNSHGEKSERRGFEAYVLSMDPSETTALTAIAKEHQTIPDSKLSSVEETLGRMRAEANLESSLAWAEPISKSLKRHIPAFGKPIKMGPFYVLYGVEMPAILLEIGFITSKADMAYFHEYEKQKQMIGHLAKVLSDRLKSLRPKPQTATSLPKDSTQHDAKKPPQ